MKMILIGTLICISVQAKVLSDAEIVDQYIPLEMVNSIDTGENPPRKVERESIGRKFIVFDYGSKNGSKVLLATYDTKSLEVENKMTLTLAIKVQKNGATSLLKAPSDFQDYGIDEKSDIKLFDLDGDNINEVIVTDFDDKEVYWNSHILKWNEAGFQKVLVPLTDGPSLQISQLQLNALPLLVYEEVIESIGDRPNSHIYKVKKMSSEGFVDVGVFNFIKIVVKDSKKVEENKYEIKNASEGQYILEVKNLSKHPRSVRAEISVNDVVALKPTDFCHGKPKLFVKQKDKKGNDISEDDDDDGDEDRCKRCDPRKDIYATVNLKPEGNNIKVKLYGNKKSKIQVTLKKK